MKLYVKDHLKDSCYVLGVFFIILFILSFTTGCSSRLHTSYHYNASGELVHKDRTRSYQLFGKSEHAGLQGNYDYSAVVDGTTNLTHSVKFGVDAEKKGVDAEGLKAGGGALGDVIGEAGGALISP